VIEVGLEEVLIVPVIILPVGLAVVPTVKEVEEVPIVPVTILPVVVIGLVVPVVTPVAAEVGLEEVPVVTPVVVEVEEETMGVSVVTAPLVEEEATPVVVAIATVTDEEPELELELELVLELELKPEEEVAAVDLQSAKLNTTSKELLSQLGAGCVKLRKDGALDNGQCTFT